MLIDTVFLDLLFAVASFRIEASMNMICSLTLLPDLLHVGTVIAT